MDLSQPISTAIPTLDGPVLAVLARTEQPLTGSRIHQLAASGSETGTRRVLRRLTTTGLVSATQVGSSVQYTLNREHLAAAAIIELATLRRRLIQEIMDAIGQWTQHPIHASLFGSAARGDGDLDSDVDLLIVHGFDDPPPEWSEQIDQLGERVHRWSGNFMQTYELSTAGLADHLRAGEPIVDEWLRDCITVYGLDFRRLRAEISKDVVTR
jgi:predicted nucleotidyltransferase